MEEAAHDLGLTGFLSWELAKTARIFPETTACLPSFRNITVLKYASVLLGTLVYFKTVLFLEGGRHAAVLGTILGALQELFYLCKKMHSRIRCHRVTLFWSPQPRNL